MAETAFAGPATGSASTRRIMREVLDMDAAGAPWHDRIVTAAAGARDYLIAQARVALNSRAAEFLRRRLGWFRRLLADLGVVNIAGYTATTIEGRRGLRAVLRFGFRVVRLPLWLLGLPVGFVLGHTGRAGRWARSNMIVVFCVARDKTVAAYDTAEAWLAAHDNHWAVRAARATFHWRIMTRLVDRFAPRWFPTWARYVLKLSVPSLSYQRGVDQVGKNVLSTAAESVIDGLEHVSTSVHDTLAAIGEELPVTRIQLRDGTGRLIQAESLTIGEDTFVRLSGEKQFVKGTAPSGYERVTLTEVASETLAAGNGAPAEPPLSNRESRREAARHRQQ